MKRAVLAAAFAAAIVSGVAAASGGPSLLHPASLHAKAPATFKARFRTTKGTFVVKVTRKWAPKGADRFYNLVRNHFYDNQPLFRVAVHPTPFVVQWGISMKPAIAKAWENATIKDDPVTHSNVKGTITFANSGKNTRTTQLFVNLGSNTFLDDTKNYPGFSPFGTVTSGFSVFSKLYHGKQSAEATEDQSGLTNYGAPYVRKHYPKLDWIKTARLVHSG
jgi:peptidyl-prolyl cis-trans isomerase A (cyclophilin A)